MFFANIHKLTLISVIYTPLREQSDNRVILVLSAHTISTVSKYFIYLFAFCSGSFEIASFLIQHTK